MDHAQVFSIWLQFGGYKNKLMLENHKLVTFYFEVLDMHSVGRMIGGGDEGG